MRALFGSFTLLGLVALLAAPAVPLLSGCDSGGPVECNSTVDYEVEDTTPDDANLGVTIKASDCVVLDYEGRVPGADEPFDSGENVPFFISNTVTGFRAGVVGRRTGQSVHITIPPQLGYGPYPKRDGAGNVTIPACSVLEFDVRIKDMAKACVCSRTC